MSPKSIQKSQVINFSAKMDDRTNAEVVNLDPNNNGIAFHYLENANLYYSKALQNRNGVQDLCCGIVNFAYNENCWYDTTAVEVSGSLTKVDFPLLQANINDYPLTVFIPSGNQVLSKTSLYINGHESIADFPALVASGEENYQIQVNAMLFKLNQVPVPASGVSFMSGNGILHSISLGGSVYTGSAPYPEFASQISPSPFASDAIAIASAVVSLGTYTNQGISLGFNTPQTEIELEFNAPAFISSGSAYAIRYSWNQTSGTYSARGMKIGVVTETVVDAIPNAGMAQEFFYVGAPANQLYAIRFTYGDKAYVRGTVCELQSTQFLSPDYSTSDVNSPLPILSGTNPGGFPDVSFEGYTQSASIGQVLPLSGVHTYYGSYMWAGANHTQGPNSWVLHNADGSLLTTGKSVGTIGRLYSIDSSTGAIVSGNYSVTAKTLLAEGSGTHTFDFSAYSGNTSQQGYLTNIYKATNNQMDKIYNMFDNPVTISGTGANYLMTFDFYDAITGLPYNDYSQYDMLTAPFFRETASALRYASQSNTLANYSGAAVLDWSGNGIYNQFSGVYVNMNYGPVEFDLTCGLINVPSGNAVVGIYDYRVGGDRSSKIVYGQAGEIRYFDLDTPCKDTHVTIHSGISTITNALMSFATYDDLLFMTDYSQVSGVCWDQTNSGTMIHGLRPVASTVAVSGSGGTIPSGQAFSLMIASDMSSGGIRTTIYPFPSGITQNFLQVSGLANQYAFDVPNANMTAYITAASGSNYYLAQAYSGNSTGSTLLPYPYASGTNVIYISRLANELTDDSFADITTYPINYALSQVNTPMMKYLSVFYDYTLGIGDPNNASRLWYSEQYAPQIWGESFNFHGYIDVDKDNGSPLVGMARLRDYMMVFKKNSTYRLEFLGNSNEPFSIVQISSKIGSIGSFGLITVGDTVYGLCEYGIFATNGATVNIISDPIDPFFTTIDHGDLTFTAAIDNMNEDNIIWSISNDNASPERDYGISFNYKEGSFSVRKGSTWNACNVLLDDDGFDVLVGGTSMGQIQLIDTPTPSASAEDVETLFVDGNGVSAQRAITMTCETPWMSVLDSQLKKEFRFIDFNIDKAVDALLKVDVYFDEDDTNKRYTRYVNLNTNNPDKRVNLGGKAKTIKLVLSNVGDPAFIKIKSMNLYFVPLGQWEEM